MSSLKNKLKALKYISLYDPKINANAIKPNYDFWKVFSYHLQPVHYYGHSSMAKLPFLRDLKGMRVPFFLSEWSYLYTHSSAHIFLCHFYVFRCDSKKLTRVYWETSHLTHPSGFKQAGPWSVLAISSPSWRETSHYLNPSVTFSQWNIFISGIKTGVNMCLSESISW